MKSTMNDVLVGLLAVERLKNQTLLDRITYLETSIQILTEENDELYKTLGNKQPSIPEHHTIGYQQKH